MFGRALYYPYICAPETSWFTRTLLYWDTVGCIVPSDYIDHPERFSPYMLQLVRSELVQQVFPGAHLWRAKRFDEAFLKFVDSKYSALISSGGSKWDSNRLEVTGSLIHMEKLHTLGDALCSRGLAKKDPNSLCGPWIRVDPRVAEDFMGYLAGVLGQLPDEEKFDPVTDTRPLMPRPLKSAAPSDRVPIIREILLESLLPAPQASVSVDQIAAFKERTTTLRRSFIQELEKQITDLAAISDDAERAFLLERAVLLLSDQVSELSSKMSEEPGWPRITLTSLCAITGGTLSLVNGAIDNDWIFEVGSGICSIIPAIAEAFGNEKIDLEGKPLAYVSEIAHVFRDVG